MSSKKDVKPEKETNKGESFVTTKGENWKAKYPSLNHAKIYGLDDNLVIKG